MLNQKENQNTPTLLVLAVAPGRLQEFERFMSRQGWTVRLHSDLKTFLQDVATLKPQYVLISMEFEHAHLERTRQMVSQVYRAELVDFFEEENGSSWQRPGPLSLSYQIQGTLTGPSFERAVHQLSLRKKGSVSEEKGSSSKEFSLKNGVKELLQKTLQAGDQTVRRPLGWTSKVYCIQVKTPWLCGHFLVAGMADYDSTKNLVPLIQNSLKALIQGLGGGVEVESWNHFPMEIRRVEFKSWARSAAQFLESGVHRGAEVAVAFLPAGAEMFQFDGSSDDGFITLEITQIRPEKTVNFDVYLHLPLNGKHLLYVSKGGWLSMQQHMNLESRGIKKLHVKADDKKSLLADRAAQQLDQSISRFYEAKSA